ncbi:glutathione S-transferase LANCL1 isoform X2 [Solenopsis invicta]|uniref:glutathione S-transferase LANCL1 isoform X2 n=1 Tax=Solenopsis invicta TaxID=13686 RepID=UPI000595D710|nr:glutathione S-transferase LANCL1 isoform X2 [Solenopsis invicta]
MYSFIRILKGNKILKILIHMDTTKHYKNRFEDYSTSVGHNIIRNDTNMIHDEFKSLLSSEINKLIEILKKNERNWINSNDYSVYTGQAGIAYTLYHYGKYFNDSVYINMATEILQKCATEFKSKHKLTFLTGVVGPLALTAVLLQSQQKKEEAEQFILKLKSLSTYVLDKSTGISDELLYGRAGYLASLLYVASHIINSGISYALSNHSQSPLMYSWHDKEYIGAAHGLAGILYLLLQARLYLTQAQIDNYIKPSLYYLKKLQFSSGNFLSSVGSPSDRLVQWCHGAPGMSALFCLAYKVFEDSTFLEIAIQCGEVIWERGLLKKGYSICHGVAGNGYAFIHLFQQTKDIKYLYRACKFAEWCFHYGLHQNRSPDRPFSLFEGLAGVIYFLLDVQQPHSAKFPTYDI